MLKVVIVLRAIITMKLQKMGSHLLKITEKKTMLTDTRAGLKPTPSRMQRSHNTISGGCAGIKYCDEQPLTQVLSVRRWLLSITIEHG